MHENIAVASRRTCSACAKVRSLVRRVSMLVGMTSPVVGKFAARTGKANACSHDKLFARKVAFHRCSSAVLSSRKAPGKARATNRRGVALASTDSNGATATESGTGSSSSKNSYTWQNSASSRPEDVLKQAQEAFSLVEEITQVTIGAGPSGLARGLKAFQAITTTGQEWLQGDRPTPPALLRKLFERLGSTYVKLGQFIASSPTLFPEEYVKEFQKCLDATPPEPFERIKSTLQKEINVPLEKVFESIDSEPLASASIAQVHAAVLKGSNKEVVLKVLKPGVSDVLNADLSFLYVASRVLEFLNPEFKRTSLSAIVGDIRASMMEEVDFFKEARNIEQFQDYLDRNELGTVATAPFVYKELSSKKVLCMERLRGSPLTDLEAIRRVSPGNDAEATLISALNTWFGSVVMCESFHADVHAGNLLVLPDGRVAFIDFGIVGRISPVTWNAIQGLTTAAATMDFPMIAAALAQMGATDQEVDIPAFAKDLKLLYEDINQIDAEMVIQTDEMDGSTRMDAGFMLEDTQINDLLLNVVRVGETHGVKFPREFGLLLKQVLYFDRYVRLLAPGLQVFNDDRVNMGPSDIDVSPSYPDIDSGYPTVEIV